MSGFTVSREEIERTLFEFIRLRLVAMGYLADVSAYQPPSGANQTAYEAALQAIRAGGKEVIEPYGIGGNEKRGEKRVNKIWINLRQLNTGSVSLWGESLDPNSGNPLVFDRTFFASSTSNCIYDIRSSCDKSEYDRICTQAILQGLTASRVGQAFPIVRNDGTQDGTRWILVRLINSTDIRQPQFFERLYTFEVQDVWLDAWGYVPYITGIPQMTEQTVNVVLPQESPIVLYTVN